jgi:hypothetical protein
MPDRAYTTTTVNRNIGLAPAIPVYRAPLVARLAASVRQCRGDGKHRGRARRHRQEIKTRQALAWLADLRSGAARVSDGRGQSYGLGDLVRGSMLGRPGWARSLQAQARNLVTLAERHGPRSGWGIRQTQTAEPGNAHWTPYYIPRAAERCWRYWRKVCQALRVVLRALARALGEVIPLHRSLLDQDRNGGEQSSSLEAPASMVPVYRAHLTSDLGAALEREWAARAT